MKITKFIIYFICCLSITGLKAQFVRGIGVFGSGTTSRHDYSNTYPDDPTLKNRMPEKHWGAERISWGVGAVVEMLPFKVFRLRSELEYINKGSNENELINPFTEERKKSTNKYSYLGINNFATLMLHGDYVSWYALAGFRAEFGLRRSTPAYSAYAGKFRKVALSPDVGIGMELISLGRLRFFSEVHYNPDIFKQYKTDNIWIKNRTWEVRIGIIGRPKKSLDLDCNAPRYIEY